MSVKPGDTVRYLNAVGGGQVVRIEGNIAYVDEDGFETPVLTRECVVIATPQQTPQTKAKIATAPAAPAAVAPQPRTGATALPVVELPDGDSVNLCVGFEAHDIKSLSTTGFDACVVNDSNYWIYLSIATRDAAQGRWTLRYDGLIEPNIQEFAFELAHDDLPGFDRMLVQGVAFKRGKAYDGKGTIDVEVKVDSTKFAKLHCFRPNRYFDGPVIAFDIVDGDLPVSDLPLEALRDAAKSARNKPVAAKGPRVSRSSKPSAEPIVVDLHVSELLDSTAGLSTADILNYQVDTFRRVMDENLRHAGRKLVFIHGKGEGVLRNAIMKELNHRYKGHDVQDASFAEYGYGATAVTIRERASEPGKHRK